MAFFFPAAGSSTYAVFLGERMGPSTSTRGAPGVTTETSLPANLSQELKLRERFMPTWPYKGGSRLGPKSF